MIAAGALMRDDFPARQRLKQRTPSDGHISVQRCPSAIRHGGSAATPFGDKFVARGFDARRRFALLMMLTASPARLAMNIAPARARRCRRRRASPRGGRTLS